MSFHKDLRGNDLHPTKIDLVESTPLASRTPEYIGETVIDTVTKSLYTASGLTANDWNLIGASGEGLSVSSATDVDITSRADEYILVWDSTTEKYIHSSPEVAHNNLNGLNDGDYVHLTAAEYAKLFTLAGDPIKPVAKYHRNANLETTAANTWIDIPWDTDIASETTTGFSRTGAVITYSGSAGILNVNGAVRPSWTGLDNSTETVIIYIRLLQSLDDGDNWTEARCIQTIGVRQQKSGVVSTSRFGGTIGAITGELIKIQYRVTNIDLDLAGSAVFDNTVAATVFLEYSTRK